MERLPYSRTAPASLIFRLSQRGVGCGVFETAGFDISALFDLRSFSIEKPLLPRFAERLSPLRFEPIEAVTGLGLDHCKPDDEKFLVRRIVVRLALAHIAVTDVVLDPNVERRRYLLEAPSHLAAASGLQTFHGAVGPARRAVDATHAE